MPTIIQEQKEVAKLVGVRSKALRDWIAVPGFPDCSAGYPIEDIRRWQQERAKTGRKLDDQGRKRKLSTQA